jgi:hypothetical protein
VADTIRKAQAAVSGCQCAAHPRAADESAKPAGHPALLFLGCFHIVLLHRPSCLLAAFLFEVAACGGRRVARGTLLLDIGAVGALITAALGLLLAANGKYDAAAPGHRLGRVGGDPAGVLRWLSAAPPRWRS